MKKACFASTAAKTYPAQNERKKLCCGGRPRSDSKSRMYVTLVPHFRAKNERGVIFGLLQLACGVMRAAYARSLTAAWAKDYTARGRKG